MRPLRGGHALDEDAHGRDLCVVAPSALNLLLLVTCYGRDESYMYAQVIKIKNIV